MALDLDLILGDQVEEPQSVDPVPETEPQAPRLNLSTILQDQAAIDNTAIDTMTTGDSKRAAEINTIAKGLNEPIGMVAENFDEKKQQYAEQQTAKVLQNAEHLRQFTADNKEVAPSVKPVLPALAKFEARLAKREEALRQQRIENNAEFNFSDEPHAWTPDQEEPEDGYFRKLRAGFAAGEYSGQLQSQVARVYENARTGKAPLTEALKAEADGKFEELAALEEVYGGTIPYSAGQIAGQMVDIPKNYMGEALSGAAQASALGAGALAVAGLAGGVTSAVAMAPLAVMAGAGAVYSSTRAIEAGLAYKDMLDSGTPKEEAAVIAGTVGTINGLVEALGDMVLGAIGGKAAGLATKTFVRNALHQAVVKQSMGQALKSVAKGYAGGISTEVTTEVFQEAVNIFGEEYAKRYNGGEAITLDEIRDRLTKIAVTTFQGSLVLGAIGAGPVLTHQIHRVHAARNRQQMFSDLAADMKGNEAVQTAPEIVGAAVQHVADKSQASNIYIDGYAFMQTMQANKVSIEDLRRVAPEIADQIENAARTGGDVVIPTGDYAVKIAPTDMGEALSMHVRTEEGQLSAAEAVQVDRVVKGMVRDAVNDPEALQQQVNEKLDEEYKEEAKKLEEQYRAEFEKYPKFKRTEARMQAKYGATVAAQMAKRAGIAPSELQNFAPTLVMVDAEENRAAQNVQNDQGISEDGAYEQEQTGITEAQAKLNAEIKEWERRIDRVASMPRKPRKPVLMLTQTPLAMRLVGAEFRRLYVAPHALDGMFPEHRMPKNSKKNRHPEMIADVIKQIPGALADPVAVLKSYNNSYVFILELNADGKTVIVPVMFEADNDGATINKVTSNYGKDDFGDYITKEVEGKGNLVYINRQKVDGQHQAAGSNSLCDAYNRLPDRDSVLTEEDLVNLQKEYPGYYQTSATPTDPLVHNQLMGEQGAGRLSPAESQALLEETADIAPEEQILLTSSNLRPQGPRGTFSPGSNTISITLNGDLSTFAHEMGHWYLEQIFTLSKRADVDPTIVEDAETIKKELGIPDDWDNLTFDAKRKYHEKFAYLTEIYLATGKAPTKSTESFFARMGAWIADVYRQFTGGIKQQRSEQYAKEFHEQLPEISPELKRVFDRMVASQDLLKQAEAAESLRPLFDTKPEDMDEATWVEMQSQRMVAEAEGAAKINELHAKDEKWYTGARSKLLRKLQREAKEIRDKIRERIETQLRNQDVYIALEIFKTGGKALGLDNLKMDPDALKDAGYTVTEIAKLRNLGCVRKGGLTPTQARELLRPFARFKTDKRMIRALINAKPIKEAIEEATTEECLRRHSEMFDPVKLDAAVTAALHTEARERMIANELKYLAGMKGMNSRVLNEAARRAAQELVAGTKVGQATVKKYMALEAKASRKAYEALAKGDRKVAAVAKHQQLLYSKCVREAMGLEKDVAKLKGLKAKIFQSDKKIGKTRDTGILGVARYILTNHGLGKIRAADMDPTAAMRYVDKLQKYQYEQFIAFKGLMERHGYKPNDPGLNAMTVQELRALIGDVEFCWKASRDAKVVKLGEAAMTREDVVTELLQQGQSLGLKEYAPGRGEKVTASERAAHGLLSIAAQLRRVESWCNGMDAGNPNKPFRRYIYDPVAQACAKYRVANAAIQEKLANLVAARRKAWDKMTDIEAPEIGYVFRTKAELIGAILHTGNQSNKQKLLLGGRGDDKPWARLIEGPDGAVRVDTSAWDAFVQRCYAEGIITKEDMDFVQAVWDLMESEKSLIQKAFYQIYGFYFDEIPAAEVQTPWGNYRGGYVPAMTDRYIVAEKGVQEEIERITENEYLTMMPVSRPGFAISRVAGYNKPLSLDIGQLCGHVEKTMRFAHIAPVVQEVAKIINDRDFTDFVNKINPHLISDLLAPWLKRAYSQRIDDGKTDLLSNLCSKYRSLAGMGIMMGNVVNAIQQVTGLSIALSKVGAAKLAVANKKLILERGALVEKVETLSPFMKARLKDRSFEYESRVKRVTSATGKIFGQRGLVNKVHALDSKAEPVRNWISSHAYLLQTAMQIPIDITVWVAAFDEAVAKGMSDHEAALEADSVVRTTQSSFAAEDVAKVETGGAFKRAFLVFYNYFGMQYNLLLERKAEANLKPWYKKYGTMAADFMLIVWIPAVLAKVFELALKGELGGDDEDEWEAIDWIQLILGEPIKNVITFAPIVGGMINTAGGALAKKGSPLAQAIFGKDPYVGKPMSSPAIDLFDSAIVNGLSDLYKIAQGEEVSRRRITRELLDLFSIISRTPAGALKKPLGYVGNVMDGEESTDNPIYGVLRGR